MSTALFPLAMPDEIRLLTAIVLGFLFGFSLERAGFGSPRKLAGQFYLNDMTVFKVMFTAILVAMVGLYGLAGMGWVDLSLLWINPTFMWAQLVGGFVLGVGFIMSGLCPGTSVVSMASGRWDAVVTFLGLFAGTFLFAVAMDLVPGLAVLYEAGSMGVSVLPELMGVPPLAFALGVVVVAGLAFWGAETVEARFQERSGPVELTPPSRPRSKMALAGSLASLALLALAAARPAPEARGVAVTPIDPLELAERLIVREPGWMILDLRGPDAEARVPGAYPVADDEEARALLASAPAGTTVVLYEASGMRRETPAGWPARLAYRSVAGGAMAWELKVLTPAPVDGTEDERRWALRQNQISGYFTGAAVESAGSAPAPPPMPAGGGAKKKKGGGC